MLMQNRWLVALAFAVSASPASAQYTNFGGPQCTTGAFQACASVELWNETDPATGELFLNLRLSNLQGILAQATPQPNQLRGFEIRGLAGVGDPALLTSVWSQTERLSSHGTLSGNTSFCTFAGCAPTTPGYYLGEPLTRVDEPDGSYRIWNSLLHWDGLWGCDFPQQTADQIFLGVMTCDGAATWQIRTGLPDGVGYAMTDQTTVLLEFAAYTADGQEWLGNHVCTAGADCATVTPEPITLILVGSGLAGVAAVRRRRRITQ